MFFSAAPTTIRCSLLLAAFVPFIFSSCLTIKNPPANKPFVFETNIALPDNFTTAEKKNLNLQLLQQLHDSITVRSVSKLIGWKKGPRFFYTEIVNPAVYDSLNADKSVISIKALLNSLGYYRDSVNYDTTLKTTDNQQRITVNFNVVNAQLFRLDSIGYNLMQDTSEGPARNAASRQKLQDITNNTINRTVTKKGEPFSKSALAFEINRLSDEYRNNGFLRFSSEEFLVLWDTVGRLLIRPTLDPIEQAQQIEELRRRQVNPIADVEFRLRTTNDTGHLIQYHIGNVKIYPDLTSDTSAFYPTSDTVKGYQFVSYRNLFKPHKLVDFIYLERDSLYRQSNLLKTQNKFSALPSWRLVNITPFTRRGTDTVDFEIKLTPANQYFFNANLEGSRNYTALVPTGSLLGVGAVISVQNRNFLRAANLFTNNVRYGVELNAVSNQSIIQTQQLSYSGTVQFPRRVPGKLPSWLWSKENVRTILGVNLAYTNRVNFFTVRTFNTSWGYEKPVRKHVWSVRFPNIEYNSLTQGQGLKDLIAANSSFNYIFNTGLILSTIGNYRVAGGNQRATNLFNSSLELSGLVASAINTPFIDSNLKRFIKVDAEFTRNMRFRRSGVALRGFLGVGLGLPQNTNDRTNFYLPFYRQYVAGGPNSMRAWGIRRLGPGSAIRSFGIKDAPDRFGDMRIELNGEYRFYMTTFSGVVLDGALFTDIGNVWFLRKNEGFVNGEFQFNRLLKDIAIGTGLGLRIDFSSFLKLRFDYAFKVKNPTPDISNPAEQNKWFYHWQLLGGQLQFGIDYPF